MPSSYSSLGNCRILVCSCNLGNQLPDEESIAAWIPMNGTIKDVVADQKYPLPEGTNSDHMFKQEPDCTLKSPTSTSETQPELPTIEDKERFDIIVIGLQEATFENSELKIPKATKAQKAVIGLTKSKNHLNENTLLERFHSFLPIKKSSQNIYKKGKFWRNKQSSSFSSNTSDHQNLSLNENEEGVEGMNMTSEIFKPKSSEDCIMMQSKDSSHVQSDTKILHDMFQSRLPEYKHVVSYQRGQMRLLMYYNDDEDTIIKSLDVLSIKAQNTGKGGLANKGGIVSEVLINGTTTLSFMSAHLEAHEGEEKYKLRCSSVADIYRGTTSQSKLTQRDAICKSHFSFAMGDLNFRTRLPNHAPGSTTHISTAQVMASAKNWEDIYNHDELSNAISQNHCFSGFSTPRCCFPPTFKLERQKGYVYNPQRSPSYTDRVLYTTGHQLKNQLKVLSYGPIDKFSTSDHKPVSAAFEIALNPKLKWRPTLIRTEGKDNKRQALHLFISSLRVYIDKGHFRKTYPDINTPSPFICFESTPTEALINKKASWKKLLARIKNLRQFVRSSKRMKDWPKTGVKRNSFDANWGAEEVNFKVRTHTKEGLPIDLSGAMLHMMVFDGRSNTFLGSFSLNLSHLIEDSLAEANSTTTALRPLKDSSTHRHLQHSGHLKRFRDSKRENACPNTENFNDEGLDSSVQQICNEVTSGPSENLLHSASFPHSSRFLRFYERKSNAPKVESMNVVSMKVQQPLEKYSLHVGRIECTVDSWWLNNDDLSKKMDEKAALVDS